MKFLNPPCANTLKLTNALSHKQVAKYGCSEVASLILEQKQEVQMLKGVSGEKSTTSTSVPAELSGIKWDAERYRATASVQGEIALEVLKRHPFADIKG